MTISLKRKHIQFPMKRASHSKSRRINVPNKALDAKALEAVNL